MENNETELISPEVSETESLVTETSEVTDSSVKEAEQNEIKPHLPNGKIRLFIGAALILFVLVAISALTSAVYLLPATDPFVRNVTTVVPYPIAVVNAEPISFKDFYVEWDAMQNYLKSQTDTSALPPAAEMQSSIIDAMTERTAIRQLAKQYGITLDQSKVDQMTESTLSQYGSEQEAADAIQKTFGWDKQLFVDRVIKPVVLSSQLEEAIYADNILQTAAKTKIDSALQRLKNGDDFAAVAKEVSEDSSAANGGDIGSLTADVVPPEWVEAVASLGLNKFSEVIDLGSAYSISMASEQTESEDSGTQFNFHIIIVNKQSLDSVLQAFETSSKVWKFFKAS